MDRRSISSLRSRAASSLAIAALLLLAPGPDGILHAQQRPDKDPMLLRTREIDGRTIREISFGGGWFEVTRADTLGRYYTDRGLEGLLHDLEDARQYSNLSGSNRWKIHLTVAGNLKAEWTGADGVSNSSYVKSDSAEIRRCVRAFQTFTNLVMSYTSGDLVIESRIDVLKTPVTKVHPVRAGEFWIPPHNVVSLKGIRDFEPDSIFLYCRPGDVPISNNLLGATYGSDRGILGAGVTTIHIPEIFFKRREELPDNIVTILTLREFLQQIHYAGTELMGYDILPGARAAPELGYKVNDLELPFWTAAIRDTMRSIYPSGFYRNAHMGILRDVERTPAPWIENRLCDYDQVIQEWPTRLPHLRSLELEQITGVANIEPEIGQFEPGGPCHLFFDLPDALYGEQTLARPVPGDSAFNNMLSLDGDSGLESMAVVRIPDKFDLIAVRMDVARPVLQALKTDIERSASRCVLGYITAKDPVEKHPINFLVAQTNFGDRLPATELEAITRGASLEVEEETPAEEAEEVSGSPDPATPKQEKSDGPP